MRRLLAVPLCAMFAAALVGAQVPARPYAQPKTPDGQPDLQGVWTNATITPLERPVELADKPFLSADEAAAVEKRTLERRAAEDRNTRTGGVGAYNEFWMDAGTKVLATRQTSLVVEPPDGRVPLTREAEAARDFNAARVSDAPEHMSVWDRCITRGIPGAMIPAAYNNAYEFIQAPGYVIILHEMIHTARIIPLGSSPHVPAALRLWDGDPRGRWEGNTLVVETTNFSGKGWIATSGAAGRIKGIPHTEGLRVIERFTRVDADTIRYDVRVEDPKMYSKPWAISMPLMRDPEYRIYEYACHEGNAAVANILRGGRVADGSANESSPGR
jgi:hypothetical protein